MPLTGALTTAELVKRLSAEDVPHAPVTSLASLHEHPQVVANGLLAETEHPVAGPMRAPRPVGDFEATPIEVQRHAPALGEHTDEVLAELGIGAEDVKALRELEIIG